MFRVYVNGPATNYDFSEFVDFPTEAKANEFNSRRGYAIVRRDLAPTTNKNEA